MKLTLLLIPITLLSSCTIVSHDTTSDRSYSGISSQTGTRESLSGVINIGSDINRTQTDQNICPPGMYTRPDGNCSPEPLSCGPGETLTGFPGSQYCTLSRKNLIGSGFTLSQTDKKTALLYQGKSIKEWIFDDTPPFMGEEGGEEWLEYRKKYGSAEDTWKELSIEKREELTKKYLSGSISVEQITERFFLISQSGNESSREWIFDVVSSHMQSVPDEYLLTMDSSSIQLQGDTIRIQLEEGHGGSGKLLIYDKNFETLLETKSTN